MDKFCDLELILYDKYLSYENWMHTKRFTRGNESFDIAKLSCEVFDEEPQSEALDSELYENMSIADEFPRKRKPLSTKTAQFLCKTLGLEIPITPVDFFEERKLFTKLIVEFTTGGGRIGFLEMSKKWNREFANGTSIFAKLPSLLQSFYTKHWKKAGN